jgi:hypothetical protein
MYAQYQSYQQPNHAASTTQSVWNGSQWVPNHSQQQEFPTHPSIPNNKNSVQTYTDWYHQWTAKIAREKQYGASPERLAWLQFQADQSSRAAHHYHNNKNSAIVAPAFVLPQNPYEFEQQEQPAQQPQFLGQQPNSGLTQAPTAAAVTATMNNNNLLGNVNSPPTDSLKRFTHRCLQAATTPQEATHIRKLLSETMTRAFQDGTFHAKNWDLEPTLTVATTLPANGAATQSPTTVEPVATMYPATNKNHDESIGNYYGPATTAAAATQPQSSQITSTPISDGDYYGPSQTDTCVASIDKRNGFLRSPSNASSYQSSSNTNYYAPKTINIKTKKNKKLDFRKKQNGAKDAAAARAFHSSPYNYYEPTSSAVTAIHNNKLVCKKKPLDDDGFNASTRALDHRAKRFAGAGGLADVAASATKDNFDRFMGKTTIGGTSVSTLLDYEQMKVKGTCQVLAKDYLRLTAPPRAELVRPPHILQAHLVNLKQCKDRPYVWLCSQFKALRQDCTVQHLQTALAVDVYESHARLALQAEDVNEYNQCQTQLMELYRVLNANADGAVQHRNEFVAYRLLYYVLMTGNQKYDGGSSDLFKILLELSAQEKKDPAIAHALKVRQAVADVDYHAFFRLLVDCPNRGAALMDRIVPSFRYMALQRICTAYRPTVEVDFVLQELGFCVEKEWDSNCAWLESCGCVLSDDTATWITKDTILRESDLEEKQSLI